MYLTKSRYLAGLQCLRRLWLSVNQPPDWEEPASGSSQDIGIEIGLKAHLLFPGGLLVDEMPWQHEEAVARTQVLMADPSVPAIFRSGVRAGRYPCSGRCAGTPAARALGTARGEEQRQRQGALPR